MSVEDLDTEFRKLYGLSGDVILDIPDSELVRNVERHRAFTKTCGALMSVVNEKIMDQVFRDERRRGNKNKESVIENAVYKLFIDHNCLNIDKLFEDADIQITPEEIIAQVKSDLVDSFLTKFPNLQPSSTTNKNSRRHSSSLIDHVYELVTAAVDSRNNVIDADRTRELWKALPLELRDMIIDEFEERTGRTVRNIERASNIATALDIIPNPLASTRDSEIRTADSHRSSLSMRCSILNSQTIECGEEIEERTTSSHAVYTIVCAERDHHQGGVSGSKQRRNFP